MEYRFAVIEDQEVSREHLLDLLMKWAKHHNVEYQVEVYESGEELFQNASNEFDLFFLDIELPGKNGLEIAQILRSMMCKAEIIFLTSYRDFVFEGYSVNAMGYLLKPLNEATLERWMGHFLQKHGQGVYRFNTAQGEIELPIQEILWFTSSGHYMDVVTLHGVYKQRISMSEILKQLPKTFVQVHRGYIVNIIHIVEITSRNVRMIDGTEIPFGRRYMEVAQRVFSNYVASLISDK